MKNTNQRACQPSSVPNSAQLVLIAKFLICFKLFSVYAQCICLCVCVCACVFVFVSVYYGNKAKQRLSGIFFEAAPHRLVLLRALASLFSSRLSLLAQLYTFLWLGKIYARLRFGAVQAALVRQPRFSFIFFIF